jgi:GMP reductase
MGTKMGYSMVKWGKFFDVEAPFILTYFFVWIINKAMHIEETTKLDFKDVLIRPKRSMLRSRKEVDLTRTYTFKHSGIKWSGTPIMAANMDGVGTFGVAHVLSQFQGITCLRKQYTQKDYARFFTELSSEQYPYLTVSTGISDDDYSKTQIILAQHPEILFICIDVANGYSEHFGRFVEKVRKDYPQKVIIAGNVVTGDMTQELILRGADIVKVGIGPGSVCTTRVQTGVGYPQLSAVIECADAAHGLGGHVISDGGCVCPGDVAKAFGAGADFVMLGGMLAGHDEGGGTMIEEWYHTGLLDAHLQPKPECKRWVEFYGMSSDTAMNKHHGGVAEYRSSEGRTVRVPYRGPIESTLKDLLGGIRSTCTYVGASSLKQLSRCTTFIKVSRQINDIFL